MTFVSDAVEIHGEEGLEQISQPGRGELAPMQLEAALDQRSCPGPDPTSGVPIVERTCAGFDNP